MMKIHQKKLKKNI